MAAVKAVSWKDFYFIITIIKLGFRIDTIQQGN